MHVKGGDLFMRILQRLFSSGDPDFPKDLKNLTFIECFNIVQRWSAHAIVDPDLDLELDNTALNVALLATVVCPYCNSKIVFGDAVASQGAQLTVKCPSCGTKPRLRNHNEIGIV